VRSAPRFAGVDRGAGHYESYFIKAARPGGGQGIWIRHTVHKRPDAEHIAVGERAILVDLLAVQQDRIGRAEVAEVIIAFDVRDTGLKPRDGRMIQKQLAGRQAAEQDAFGHDRDRIDLKVFTNYDEGCVHLERTHPACGSQASCLQSF